MGRPKKYHTEEELREARCQKSRKYYNTHREAIFARRAKATKRKRAAMKTVRKVTSAGEDPRAASSGEEEGNAGASRVEYWCRGMQTSDKGWHQRGGHPARR